jgi:flavin reductase (DIM6/NTAB) family NADH-FMN oxidoreductase RutF
MEILPEDLSWLSVYNILVGSIVPRPIGWISTVNLVGQPNLAPFSFFNAVCPNPPHVLFCPNVRITDRQTKDSLLNVRATGEFVVNIVTEDLAEAMNLTSTELPAAVNEFEFGGLSLGWLQAPFITNARWFTSSIWGTSRAPAAWSSDVSYTSM